jgi:hypothetical protein
MILSTVSTNVVTVSHNNYNYRTITPPSHRLAQPHNATKHINSWQTRITTNALHCHQWSPTNISFDIEMYVSIVHVALLHFQACNSVLIVDLIYVCPWTSEILWCSLSTIRTYFSSWSRATSNNLIIRLKCQKRQKGGQNSRTRLEIYCTI